MPDDFVDETVKAMDARSVRQKHERTLSRNNLNPSPPADRDGLLADGAFPRSSIHPNPPYIRLGTVVHN